MKSTRLRIAVLAVLLLLAVSVVYWQAYETDIAETRSASAELIDLRDFAQFRDVFAADSGSVRLISILSPV